MVDCDYCEETVDCGDSHDQEFLTHLAEEHFDELGAVDKRLVENVWDGNVGKLEDDTELKPAIVAGIFAGGFALVIGVFAVQMLGIGTADATAAGTTGDWVYEQGVMEITVDGEQVDAAEFADGEAFYVAEGSSTWHMNVPTEDRLRIAEGLEELGVVTVDGGSVLVTEAFTDDTANADLSVRVNGEVAELGDLVQDDDRIEVSIESGN